MESLKIQIDEKLAKRFRETAMKMFGYSKETINKAAEACIRNWVDGIEEIEKQRIKDPITAVDGLLADINIGSVELQHKMKDMWTEIVKKNVSH